MRVPVLTWGLALALVAAGCGTGSGDSAAPPSEGPSADASQNAQPPAPQPAVMYDRQTESWWQQFGGEAVVGELAGKSLRQIPARIVAWEDFKREHAGGKVLSRERGDERPYGENPYTGYDTVDLPPFFPAANLGDDRLQPKERVVFIELGREAVAVPFPGLERATRQLASP